MLSHVWKHGVITKCLDCIHFKPCYFFVFINLDWRMTLPPLYLGLKKSQKEETQAGQARKPVLASAVRCRMISSHLYWPKPSISGLLSGSGTWTKKAPTDFLAQTPCKLYWMQWYHRPNSYTRSNLISRPKPDLIDETKSGKPHLQAATVSTCYFFPRKKSADAKLRYWNKRC